MHHKIYGETILEIFQFNMVYFMKHSKQELCEITSISFECIIFVVIYIMKILLKQKRVESTCTALKTNKLIDFSRCKIRKLDYVTHKS